MSFSGEADYKIPGKEAVWSNSTYTYTTAKIMHPTDQYDNTALTSMYVTQFVFTPAGPAPDPTYTEPLAYIEMDFVDPIAFCHVW